ncbi:hypothetical protein BGW80DRAFT_1281649 [Lactifluus volemus]|nr:hypothetical protein BGW80DRAFT_1281649 [Lactifluus volemus]
MNHYPAHLSSPSLHPTGHLFALDHTDGSIAFWAVKDSEQTLMVRTLDEVDVHKVEPREPI